MLLFFIGRKIPVRKKAAWSASKGTVSAMNSWLGESNSLSLRDFLRFYRCAEKDIFHRTEGSPFIQWIEGV